MDLAWRIALAAIGLLLLRGVLFSPQWGHGGPLRRLFGAAVCLLLVSPLVTRHPGSAWVLVPVAAVWLFPFQWLVLGALRRAGLAGGRLIARQWDAPLKTDGDLWEVVQGDRARWMGNVLTRVRSLHPGVAAQKTYYMLAFSLKLAAPPPVLCSIMRGWTSPKYYDSEWRQTTMMQGDFVGLSLGDALHEGKIPTGGSASALRRVDAPDPRLGGFTAVAASDAAAFAALFSGALLDVLLDAASRTFQFEMNVTPTTVNVYTTYCGPAAQKAIVVFLETAREALDRR